MLLIWSCAGDRTVDWFISTYLSRSPVQWFRLNTEDAPQKIRFRITPTRFALSSSDTTIQGDDVHAVWYRRPQPTKLTDISLTDTELEFVADETRHAFDNLRDQLRAATWVNQPDRNSSAARKLPQLAMAARLGLTVPQTLVSNDARDILSFAQVVGGSVIAKPLHRGAVSDQGTPRFFYTHLLKLQQLQDLAHLLWMCPLIFQAPIRKAFDVRVVIIRTHCFAFSIDSQSLESTRVDWRRSPYHLHYSSLRLPESVAAACVAMTTELGLVFAALDLICTPEGEFVFLECNPNGQFAWLEEFTGVPIGRSLLDVFASPHPSLPKSVRQSGGSTLL